MCRSKEARWVERIEKATVAVLCFTSSEAAGLMVVVVVTGYDIREAGVRRLNFMTDGTYLSRFDDAIRSFDRGSLFGANQVSAFLGTEGTSAICPLPSAIGRLSRGELGDVLSPDEHVKPVETGLGLAQRIIQASGPTMSKSLPTSCSILAGRVRG